MAWGSGSRHEPDTRHTTRHVVRCTESNQRVCMGVRTACESAILSVHVSLTPAGARAASPAASAPWSEKEYKAKSLCDHYFCRHSMRGMSTINNESERGRRVRDDRYDGVSDDSPHSTLTRSYQRLALSLTVSGERTSGHTTNTCPTPDGVVSGERNSLTVGGCGRSRCGTAHSLVLGPCRALAIRAAVRHDFAA
jgi:hypothetical protein